MRFIASTLAAVGVLASTVVAADETRMTQVVKRATGPTDVEILNYALTLEYLERDFYAEGLKKFDAAAFQKAGQSATVYNRFVQIAAQEKQHAAFLAGALGSAGVGECKYNFGITDVPTFVAISRILESVGTAAYLGAAPDISASAYLAAAGSILTVEARHTSYLNEISGGSGFPAPYDAPLSYNQVYSLAAGFIVPGSCGSSGTLPPGIKAYPALKIKGTKPVRSGGLVGLQFKIPTGYTGPYYAVFVNGAGTVATTINSKNGVAPVPAGFSGITYIIISKTQTLTDASTIAGPAITFL